MNPMINFAKRRQIEGLGRASLADLQLAALNRLLTAVVAENRFYAEKLSALRIPLASLADLPQLPFTFKEELAEPPRHGALAVNQTYPLSRYTRFHQTSGTRGRALVVLDTAEDWSWWIHTWQYVLDAARITHEDRVLLAFSFGPFVGFWSAFDALAHRGALVIPSGGLSTLARLELLRLAKATVLFSTPSYALHMAEIAAHHQIDARSLGLHTLVLAGEPGASIPAVRAHIEDAWQARVLDHAGASEVGPWGYGDPDGRGLFLNESEFLAEFFSVSTGQPAGEGELSELVITALGRVGCPVIRYRTGDLVRPVWHHDGLNRFVLLDGGVLGRTDDMMVVRGVNIFPSSVEQIIRSFPEVVEYRLTVHRVSAMDHLSIEIEDRLNQPLRVAEELRLRLGLKVDVTCVPLGSLPRSDGKGKRFVDRR